LKCSVLDASRGVSFAADSIRFSLLGDPKAKGKKEKITHKHKLLNDLKVVLDLKLKFEGLITANALKCRKKNEMLRIFAWCGKIKFNDEIQ
jgi:hypothetical protein